MLLDSGQVSERPRRVVVNARFLRANVNALPNLFSRPLLQLPRQVVASPVKLKVLIPLEALTAYLAKESRNKPLSLFHYSLSLIAIITCSLSLKNLHRPTFTHLNAKKTSHPNLFLDGAFSVHGDKFPTTTSRSTTSRSPTRTLSLDCMFSVQGVPGPFDVDRSPPCDSSGSQGGYGSDQAAQWTSIMRSLSSSRFVSFAIGPNSVVDTILRDNRNLSGVSVFAPPNTGFISSPSPFLDKIVKIHILPKRFGYLELSAAVNLNLRTLVPSYYLKMDKFL
ncbi:fasciclin-like arabinogalactan protein 21 [Striga asiatica]|uniref:Fasciclin-like arabinogalactan protein 21 n=1 Tax=Striga asiatica TaxID=4170 RepID=A0A5A7R7A9_STRAF|nr:fasciclin-like arabinogalactan protein 21 [Striga asiatica]